MDFRQRLANLNSFGWFLIIFTLLMVGGIGYALGTQSVSDNNSKITPKRFHNKRLVPEQDQTTRPLQGRPSNLQGGDSELPASDSGSLQQTPTQPEDDLLYPYDPGYCNHRKPADTRECIY